MIKRTKKIITFDIGGTNISGGVIEFKKKGYEFLDYFKQKNPKNSQGIRKIILEKSLEYRKKYKTKKVAVSTSKIINNEKNCVLQAKPVYGVEKFSFDFLKNKRFSVEIENDGVCFARGEYIFGVGESEGLLTLTIGTGLGGGFISQGGEILRGLNNSAMEISFLKVKKDKRWVNWFEIASGSGVEKIYFSKTKKRKKAEDIFDLQENGNKTANDSVQEVQEFLGVGIANLVDIFDPEKIILSGGLSKRKKFIKEVIMISKKNIFNKKGKYKFVISDLGRKANQLGAASLYF